jgi:hypothetical protein
MKSKTCKIFVVGMYSKRNPKREGNINNGR